MFWRALTISVLVIGAAVAIAAASGRFSDKNQIARVTISGTITENREQIRMLRRIANAKHVKAVIVAINSPGGTTTGGEALFDSLRSISAAKPVVAQFGTVAASAAYIAGLACDHIVARGNTITGSVGVIVQWPEFSLLLDKIGIKINEVKSGPLKATPSPFQPLDDRSRKLTEEMIADSQAWFLSLVATRRGLNPADVPGLTDGRIYSGREAQRLNLIDEIGAEREAVKWLEQKRNIKTGLRIVDWKPRQDLGLGFPLSLAQAGEWLGEGMLAELANRVLGDGGLGSLALDGLVSVWHPSKN